LKGCHISGPPPTASHDGKIRPNIITTAKVAFLEERAHDE
jgi:hypothetical protein